MVIKVSDRQIESKQRLYRSADFSIGAYMEQEAKKEDVWRDQTLGQLFNHMSHELKEIRGNMKRNEKNYLLHNATDMVGLALIFHAKVMELSPVEGLEEGFYKTMKIVCISGFVASALITLHMFDVFFLSLTGVFLVGSVFFYWWNKKRFGERDSNLAERVVKSFFVSP